MRARVPAVVALLMGLAVSGAAWGQAAAPEPKETVLRGKVDGVTVYRGQALVTRMVDVPAAVWNGSAGEVVVSELPERLVAGSLFAEGGGGLEVRSVRYRERAVGQDVREEVRKLDTDARAAADKIAANQKALQVLAEQRTYLDKLENFAAPTANAEMTKGVLNADQLKTLTEYQFSARQRIADQELKLQQEARDLKEQAGLIDRQKAEVSGRSSRTLREAVVFLGRAQGNAAAAATLRVRYLVEGASWTPSYNVRADAAKTGAVVEYEAAIQQQSGEDWNDVGMTLSTAAPSLVAAAPALKPLSIALVANSGAASGGADGIIAGTVVPSGSLSYRAVRDQLGQDQRAAESVRNANGNNIEGAGKQAYDDNDRRLNSVADRLQVLELLAGERKAGDDRITGGTREGVVVTYALPGRTSLPSRSDRQLVQIDRLAVKSAFYKVAVPVLTSYVYDEAELVNTSKLVLLEGPVSSYVGGEFVGSGAIETVAVGQPFTVGFGIDSSLRAGRERIDRTEQTQGGNRVVNYTYRLTVENFGDRPANVRLLDRVPQGRESEVRVTYEMDEKAPALSADKSYQAAEKKKGVLRWDVEVGAGKAGSEAFALSYRLRLEHDKNLAISTSGVIQGEELRKLLQQQ
jgi:hypothetical protein